MPVDTHTAAPLDFDVAFAEERNRLTTGFRVILGIPHLVIRSVWQDLAGILALVQWFIVVFTGKRNRGIWDLQRSYLGYDARVSSYVGLLSDPYPAFGTVPTPQEPVRWQLDYREDADRLRTGLRIIWIIPAAIVTLFVAIGVFAVSVVSWFAILFTGKHPQGMFAFMLRGNRLVLRLTAYALLMTDTYPKLD